MRRYQIERVTPILLPHGILNSASWRYTVVVPPSLHPAIPADNTLDLVRRIETGLLYSVLDDLAHETGLRPAAIASIMGIAPRTLARRKSGGRFARGESERIVRFSRVFGLAADLFDGDREAAMKWLSSPHRALGGKAALAYLGSEAGAHAVEELIGRLEHGVFT
jgi:putative toxin-antitoxin system antitoxin component (TIGR02293 family)